MSIEKEARVVSQLLHKMAHDERILDKEATLKRNAEIGLLVDFLEKNADVAESIIAQLMGKESSNAVIPSEESKVETSTSGAATEDIEPPVKPAVKPAVKTAKKKYPKKYASEKPEAKEAQTTGFTQDPPAEVVEQNDNITGAVAKKNASAGIFGDLMHQVRKGRLTAAAG